MKTPKKELSALQITDPFGLPDDSFADDDLPEVTPESLIPDTEIVAEVHLNGPDESFYGEVGYAKKLEDCDMKAATTFEITVLDEQAAQAYGRDLESRLRSWVKSQENPGGVLMVTVEGRKVSVTSLSGDPIVGISIHAAHIASSVRSTAFRKES